MKAILRKVIIAVVGAAMLAASAAVMVVAAAMAVYGLLRPYLGDPGAAAAIVLAAGLVMLAVGWALESRLLKARAHKPAPADDHDPMRKLVGIAQEKPLIAAGALIGAIFLAIRNPALTAVVAKTFLDPKPRPRRKA